jgi:hypothetical protein
VFSDKLQTLSEVIHPVILAPPASDRTLWTSLPAELSKITIDQGKTALSLTWPHLPISGFLEFVRSGDRDVHQEKSFARRRILNALVLAECVEHSGRYMDAIVDALFSLCEETAWQLPAHNSYHRGGARLPLPDSSRPIIDLFAAETGAQLATIVALLRDEMNSISPEVTNRIERELQTRIFAPYLNSHFWWMGDGDEPMNNWTAWCTQNVLQAAFAIQLPGKTLRKIVIKAAHSLDAFAKDYGNDGACSEGAAYYHHAALCMGNALRILSAAAPETFGHLWQHEKIRNMAEFIAKMHVVDGYFFNFSDAAAVLESCGTAEFLFGKAVRSELLMSFSAEQFATRGGPCLRKELNLQARIDALFGNAEITRYKPTPRTLATTYFPSIELMVSQHGEFSLAVKGGTNGDSHNHNDVGSFTLYKAGRPVLIDVGVETYTAKTFSSRRYEIWTMQSGFHNLPSFGGVEQKDGAECRAKHVVFEDTASCASLSLDISGAYPSAAQVSRYHRHVSLGDETGFRLTDSFDSRSPVTHSLMFAEMPELGEDRIHLPGLATLSLTGVSQMRLEHIAITDARLRQSWPETLYRVVLTLSGNAFTLSAR